MAEVHSLARKLEKRVVAQWERELKARGLGSPLIIFVEFDWCSLSGDAQRIIFSKLCNVLDPRVAVAFSSVTSELRALTQAERQQLRADHEVAAALCLKLGLRTHETPFNSRSTLEQCSGLGAVLRDAKMIAKMLREAKAVTIIREASSDDLALLGTLGSVLPALKYLTLCKKTATPDGVQRLAEKLGAGALPAMASLSLGDHMVGLPSWTVVDGFCGLHVGDAGASALAAALGRGAMPRLEVLHLVRVAIGDVGMVALAPALRRLPLWSLCLAYNPFGDEGIAALVAPPPPAGGPPAGAPSPMTGGLTKLNFLELSNTKITEAGCATLAAAIESDTLPALKTFGGLDLRGIPASYASKRVVGEALERSAQKARGVSGLPLALDLKILSVMKKGLVHGQA